MTGKVVISKFSWNLPQKTMKILNQYSWYTYQGLNQVY